LIPQNLYNLVTHSLNSCRSDEYIAFGCQNCVMWSCTDHMIFDVIFPDFTIRRIECDHNQLWRIISNKLDIKDVPVIIRQNDFLHNFGFRSFINNDASPDKLRDTLPQWFLTELMLWRLKE